jgi:hypothetical protein
MEHPFIMSWCLVNFTGKKIRWKSLDTMLYNVSVWDSNM